MHKNQQQEEERISMQTIVGVDISNNNGQINWPVFKNNINFVIMKAGEGASYIDPWFAGYLQQARVLGLLRGIYHFARPDLGNTPEQEAAFFVNLVKGQGLQEGESIYLDYEKPLGAGNVAWALRWLQLVEEALGVKPLFYSYQSMLTREDWTPVVQAGYGLWVAAPTNDPAINTFVTGAWPYAAIQQWGNQTIPGAQGIVDADVFFGTADQFLAYGYHSVAPLPSNVPPSSPADPVSPSLAAQFGMTVSKSKNFDVVAQSKFFKWTNDQAVQINAGASVVAYIQQLQDQIVMLQKTQAPAAPTAPAGSSTPTPGVPTVPSPIATPAGGGAQPAPATGPAFQNGNQPVSSTPANPTPAAFSVEVSPQQQAVLKGFWANVKAILRTLLW